MKISGNTVLITGGATGIGFALAEAFLDEGSEVLICGRREDKLMQAQQRQPELYYRVCDVTEEEERGALLQWVKAQHPQANILVNNG